MIIRPPCIVSLQTWLQLSTVHDEPPTYSHDTAGSCHYAAGSCHYAAGSCHYATHANMTVWICFGVFEMGNQDSVYQGLSFHMGTRLCTCMKFTVQVHAI